MSIRLQCALLGLSRSSVTYEAVRESPYDLALRRCVDALYTRTPFYGSRRMRVALCEQGYGVNRKRVQRLMRRMGLWGIAPGPHTSRAHPGHKVYPYLLRDVVVERPNQVWSTDITYIPMRAGFMFLVAILDWYSRYVLAFALSNTLDTVFCLEALEEALISGRPEIFNTDQGCQFTSAPFTGVLEAHEVLIRSVIRRTLWAPAADLILFQPPPAVCGPGRHRL